MQSNELKELLTRCWMTHDAMWFMATAQECGIETANKLNKAAIRGLAPIEIRRVCRAMAMKSVQTPADVRAVLEGAKELLVGDYMDFDWQWQEDGSVIIEVQRCFAHDGVARLGLVDQYQCGIFERLFAWLDALEVDWEIEPKTAGCLMVEQGHCRRQFSFA